MKTYSRYKTGASHKAKNIGCEDYASSYKDDYVSIAVISDGHGDKNCFRSFTGAYIACNTAIQCVKETFDTNSSIATLKKSPDRIITELERKIIREWNRAVEQDLTEKPIRDFEMINLSEDVIQAVKAGKNLHGIYGCTLIMCVVVDGFWFGIHVGDGKCVAALKNGLYTEPIPWDEKGCVGNRSTSICSFNAFSLFRYSYGFDIPTGLFVFSDGVDESFDEIGLNRFCYLIGSCIQTLNETALDSKADELLNKISKNGSGDDVSIACILSETDEIKKPYISSKQVSDKFKELISNIKNNELRLQELDNSRKKATEELENLKLKIKLAQEQITIKEREILNIEENLRTVVPLLFKDIINLPKAEDTKRRIDEYWKGNNVKVDESEINYKPKFSEEYLKTNFLNYICDVHEIIEIDDEIHKLK